MQPSGAPQSAPVPCLSCCSMPKAAIIVCFAEVGWLAVYLATSIAASAEVGGFFYANWLWFVLTVAGVVLMYFGVKGNKPGNLIMYIVVKIIYIILGLIGMIIAIIAILAIESDRNSGFYVVNWAAYDVLIATVIFTVGYLIFSIFAVHIAVSTRSFLNSCVVLPQVNYALPPGGVAVQQQYGAQPAYAQPGPPPQYAQPQYGQPAQPQYAQPQYAQQGQTYAPPQPYGQPGAAGFPPAQPNADTQKH